MSPYAGTPYEGLDPLFAARIKAMIDSSGGRLSVRSGYRSYERQLELFQQAVRKYGSEAAARKWAADPRRGRGSNHQHGLAVDLKFNTPEAIDWAHQNAARYGLFFPMSWENWHIEPIRTTLEEDWNPDAYTEPPIGVAPAGDPHDPSFQMTRMLAMMDADIMGAFASPGDPTSAGNETAMAMMGAAGGQVEDDDGAAYQTFGFTEPPENVAESMQEQGLGDD